ncbi:MAG TPA: histidine phosphatase family protein [Thermoplasmata archaeon]|nr:histidine phosphatase family protein [Thermoplasmata archaeon]
MRLVVVRHGPSEPRDPVRWVDDDRRPLTRDGRKTTRGAADGLAILEPNLRTLLTSPATRARSTAEILRERLGAPKAAEWAELAPEAPAAPLLERLARHHEPKGTVAVVGHEPQMGELIGLSLTGEAVSITRLSKAGAAAISFPKAVRAGAGTLDWRLDRRALARLGDSRD